MNRQRFRYSLASLNIAVVISAFVFAAGPVAILLGTACVLIFGTVRAVRIPGRVRLFWLSFLLVGSPVFFAAWLPVPGAGNLFNYLLFFTLDNVGNVFFNRTGGEPGTTLDLGTGLVVGSFWASVPLLLGLASGKLVVWLFGR